MVKLWHFDVITRRLVVVDTVMMILVLPPDRKSRSSEPLKNCEAGFEALSVEGVF
jgi:hypothetical protein